MRLDINYKEKTVGNTNTWRLNNTFLNNQPVNEEIKRENKEFLETSNNENTTTQNLWDAAKTVLTGKFIAIQSYLKKKEKHRIDNLTLHLKQLGKEEQQQQQKTLNRKPNFAPKTTGKRRTKKKTPKISRKKEIIKIRAEINEEEMKETIVKINKSKSWFFEKINKIDKTLARLIEKKREKNKST